MILEIRQLRLAYGSRILAPDISFHLEGGECVLLAGANGCGKSTLLRTLAGEGTDADTLRFAASLPDDAAAGPSRSYGHGRPQVSAHTPAPAKCILIPTGIPKVKGFTVEEFVRTGCFRESDWAGRLSVQTELRLQGALDLLGLRPQAGQDISTLSDGEFQKACIAVGLTRRADVLLLDEPTAFLDVDNRVMVLQTLRKVAQETGMAVLFSSHDLHEALQAARRVLAFTPAGTFLESTQKNRREVLQAAFPILGAQHDKEAM